MISLLFMWACGGEVENKSTNSNFQPLQQQIEKQLEKEKQEKKEIGISGNSNKMFYPHLHWKRKRRFKRLAFHGMNLLRNTSTF